MACYELNSAPEGYTGTVYNTSADCEADCILCNGNDYLCPEGRVCCSPLIGAFPNTIGYDTANSKCLEVPAQFMEQRPSCGIEWGPGYTTTGRTGSFIVPWESALFYVSASFVLRDRGNIPIADWSTVSLTANGETINFDNDPDAEFARNRNLSVTFCKPQGQTSVDYAITYTTIEPYSSPDAPRAWSGLCYRNVTFLNEQPDFVYNGFSVTAAHANSNTCPCDWLSDIQPQDIGG